MTTLFGVPMQNIMVGLLAVMGVCLLGVAFIAWRNRTMFLIGVRNVPRRKAQTVLIVFGLMLATLIIASAMTVGDTLTYSIKQQVYDQAGRIDLTVQRGAEDRGQFVAARDDAAYFDAARYDAVRGKVAGDANITALMPAIHANVAALDTTTKQSEPVVTVMGLAPADAAAFGGLAASGGGTIDLAALRDGEVVLNQSLATSMNAKAGDRVTLYARNQPHEYTLARIAADGGLGGAGKAVVLPVAGAQALLGQAGKYNAILVSTGSTAANGLDHDQAARTALASATAGTGLAVNPLKHDLMAQAEQAGNLFTSFFLLFGLFAIGAGVMLIFLIFVMLAAERRGEMGMARAVGTKRRHLIQSFVAEGAAYDLLAAAVGAALGVGVAFAMVGFMVRLLGSDSGFSLVPHVELRSLAIAYALGVVVTFATIVVSSWRVSRLNIVAAIRDLEDAPKPGGTWRGLALGIAGVAGGLLLAASADGKAASFMGGASIAILAATLILRRLRLPSRLIYSLAGGALVLFWGLPSATFDRIFGKYDGGIEMFFISGVMMIAGATLLIANNTELLLAALSRVGGAARRVLPALRIGTAYPQASRFRTGLTIYMFALIMFVLVMMSAMQLNFNQVLNDPAKQTGGWDVTGATLSSNPTDPRGVRAALAAAGVKDGDVTAIGGVARVPAQQARVQNAGSATAPAPYPLNGVDDGFLANTGFHLQARADGYADDAAVWAAMRRDPSLVVIDTTALPGNGDPSAAGGWTVAGITATAKTFAPVPVVLRSPQTGQSATVTVIGVTDTLITGDTTIPPLFGMFVPERTLDAVFGPQPVTGYLFKLRPGVDAAAMAHTIRAALLPNGMQAASIRALVAENNQTMTGFFTLLEGFIALGLVVGIAALGVIAFRAVVERRQQIGMLRAIGFSRGMVATSFLIESTFITALGILAGASMGLLLAHNLFTGDVFAPGGSAGFAIPWAEVGVFAAVALVAALLMTIIPSRQAGNVAPAEALRFE
ncbi:MAG TPA: FtsX-like permease family protein [Thermomicrobiales bacterium]|nr:FtsX-like permease family protein [Thermomicrobiales bacterium]